MVRDSGFIPLSDSSGEIAQQGAKVSSGGGGAVQGSVNTDGHGVSPVGFRDAERYRRNKTHGVQSWQGDFNRTIESAADWLARGLVPLRDGEPARHGRRRARGPVCWGRRCA